MTAVVEGAGPEASFGVSIVLPFEPGGSQHAALFDGKNINFRYFFSRKLTLTKESSGYVVFPGGFGTLDELSEVLVLIQTEKVHRFPVFLLDRGYWEGLVRWLAFLRDQKAVGPEDLGLFRLLDEPEEVVQALKAEAPPR